MNSEEMAVIQNIIGGGFMTMANFMRDVAHIKKAFVAIRSVYSTLETESLIPPYSENNYNKLTANNINGKIEFKNVYFAYPTNPDHLVFKDINMTILPGENVLWLVIPEAGKFYNSIIKQIL